MSDGALANQDDGELVLLVLTAGQARRAVVLLGVDVVRIPPSDPDAPHEIRLPLFGGVSLGGVSEEAGQS